MFVLQTSIYIYIYIYILLSLQHLATLYGDNLHLWTNIDRIVAHVYVLWTVHYLLGVRDQCFGVRDNDFF